MGIRSTHFLWCGVTALVVTTFADGCTPLKESEDHRPPDEASADRPCATHRRPPPRPNVVGVGGNLDLVFAFPYASDGTGPTDGGLPTYATIGFDLDNTCTGEGQGPSCVEPPWVTPERYHDGVDGIDNATAALTSVLFPGAPDTFNAYPEVGGSLARVRDYSGDPDDDQVEVDAYSGWRISPRPDGGTQLVWDGQDRWIVQPEMLVPLEDGGYDVDQPRYRDLNAYVSGGILVYQFADVLSPAGASWSPGALMHVAESLSVARLVHGPDGWELQDFVGDSRIPFNDYLRILARAPDLSNMNLPICQNKEVYEQKKRQVCSYLDLASIANAPPSAPCDALSAGVTGVGKEAKLGEVGPAAPPLADCPPDQDPDTDTCDGGVP